MRKPPVQKRSQVTVAAILEASAQVLRQHGYKSATTNRIANRAGVSVGTVYQYFSNKDEILDALLEQESDAYISAISSHMTPSNTDIRGSIRSLLIAGYLHQDLIVGMREALKHAPESVYAKQGGILRNRLHHHVKLFLEGFGVQGNCDEIEEHADILIGICESQTFLARRERSSDELIELLTRAICQYIQPAINY